MEEEEEEEGVWRIFFSVFSQRLPVEKCTDGGAAEVRARGSHRVGGGSGGRWCGGGGGRYD